MDALTRTSETLLDGLLGVNTDVLGDHELVQTMMAARRLASRVQAVELAAVAELARRRFAEDTHNGDDDRAAVEVLSPRDYVHDEVAEALTLTSASAQDLIRFATELTGRLPSTFTALAAGDIDYGKAHALWRGTDQVDDGLTQTIEVMVLPKAPAQTTGEIRAKIRRLVKRLAPEALARRRDDAEHRRTVALIQTDDGTAHLTGADLPADAASAAYGRITAIAAGLKRDGDGRGIDQLRADVFVALLRGTLTTTEPATDTADRPIGEPPTRNEPGWTGVDDTVADAIAEAARTELTALTDGLPERHRDIGVLIARAAERVTRSLTDLRDRWCVPAPSPARDPGPAPGRDAGPRHGLPGYRPPAAMRRLIEHRDRRCCFPGCRRPVRHCDADHSVPFRRGGATCHCNLAMLCRRHHRLKQTRGWRIEHLWPGVILWIGPTGHWRITAPADRE
jgi:hypothetical protein